MQPLALNPLDLQNLNPECRIILGLYWVYTGIVEKNMETRIMEKKMETTT